MFALGLIEQRKKEKWTLCKIFGSICQLTSRGESAALGRRVPRANLPFLKGMKGKILNFLREVEKMISVILIEKLDFPSLKKIDLIFTRKK